MLTTLLMSLFATTATPVDSLNTLDQTHALESEKILLRRVKIKPELETENVLLRRVKIKPELETENVLLRRVKI